MRSVFREKRNIVTGSGRKHGFKVLILMLVFGILSGTVWADEVTDAIHEAIISYKEGRYSEAVEGLDYASRLIRQKRAEMLKTLLPEPLPEWTAEDASSESAGLAMLGGILTAKRIYKKGVSRVTIEITDSPAFQNLMAMLSSFMFTTIGDGRLRRIKGQKAIVKYVPDARDGEITVMVENRCMISIKGEGVTEEDLIDYASGINYKKLKAF